MSMEKRNVHQQSWQQNQSIWSSGPAVQRVPPVYEVSTAAYMLIDVYTTDLGNSLHFHKIRDRNFARSGLVVSQRQSGKPGLLVNLSCPGAD